MSRIELEDELERVRGQPESPDKDQQILLLRARIDHLNAKEFNDLARRMRTVLEDEIANENLTLQTMLLLASDPELVRRIFYNTSGLPEMESGPTTDANILIQQFRQRRIDMHVFWMVPVYYRYDPKVGTCYTAAVYQYHLLSAAKYGHDEVLERMLKQKRNLLKERYLAEAAAENGHLSTLKLLRKYFDLSVPILNEALILAAQNNDMLMIEHLLKWGADPRYLGLASRTHPEIIQLFIRLVPYDIEYYLSAILACLSCGLGESFYLLYDKCPDKNELDYHRLIVSCVRGNLYDIFCFLMDEHWGTIPTLTLDHIVMAVDNLDNVDFVLNLIADNEDRVTTWRQEMMDLVARQLLPGDMNRWNVFRLTTSDIGFLSREYMKKADIVTYLVRLIEIINGKSPLKGVRYSLLGHLAYAPPITESDPYYCACMKVWALSLMQDENPDQELLDILRRKGLEI